MTRIFLGSWWHWGMLMVITALLWLAGQHKMHVIHFNLFISLLVIGTIVCVFLIVWLTPRGARVTRSELIDDTDSE